MERQERNAEIFLYLVWFLFCFGLLGFFVVAVVCLLGYLVLFSFVGGGAPRMRGDMGHWEVNIIGMHDLKPPKIQ